MGCWVYILVLALLSCQNTKTKEQREEIQETLPSFPRVEADLAEFDAEVERLRSSFRMEAGASSIKQIQDELANMAELDQFMRNNADRPHDHNYSPTEAMYFRISFSPRWKKIDDGNTARLKQIIEEHGWITISRFGAQADSHAWLLVQHADDDAAFQRKVLAMLENHLKTNDTSLSNFAYLHDRVSTAEDRPQRYEGRCVGPGKWEPDELEDSAQIDAIRASVGLEALALYKARFIEDCH